MIDKKNTKKNAKKNDTGKGGSVWIKRPPKDFIIKTKVTDGCGRKQVTLDTNDQELLDYISDIAVCLNLEDIGPVLGMGKTRFFELLSEEGGEKISDAYYKGTAVFKMAVGSRLKTFILEQDPQLPEGMMNANQLTAVGKVLQNLPGYKGENNLTINNYSGPAEHVVSFVNVDEDDETQKN
ncbi:MAG: hypothetical protein EB116_17660, partial [Betaproteobacteria bacterium]|nr:hypothetical protein [Chitinophagia bacterium]NDF51877.1 hypothetical protein [Betaproteobacteria bacterium]